MEERESGEGEGLDLEGREMQGTIERVLGPFIFRE